MMNLKAYSEGFMNFAASSKLQKGDKSEFTDWVCDYLAKQLKPIHVSVWLYDDALESYSVRSSIGRYRIPPKLVRLDPDNCLIRLLEEGEMISAHAFEKKDLLTATEFIMCRDPLSMMILDEMKRHRVEVCVKIKEHDDKPIGYMMIGPQEGGHHYSEDDLEFFKALAADIAQDIEQRKLNAEAKNDPLAHSTNTSLELIGEELKNWTQRLVFEGGEFSISILEIKNGRNDPTEDEYRTLMKRLNSQVSSKVRIMRSGNEIFVLIGMDSTSRKGTFDIQDFRYQALQTADRLFHSMEEPYSVHMGMSFIWHKMEKSESEIIGEAKKAIQGAKKLGPGQLYVYSHFSD